MAVLFISDRVEAELDELWEASQDDAALFLVLMETLQDEPHIIEILNRPRVHHAHKPTFEIKQFAAMQRRGKNVLIIKVWSEQGQLSPFRGFLAHDSQRDEYSLLMVVN